MSIAIAGRLRELLVSGAAGLGVSLDEQAMERFAIYLNLLREWGRKINLTTRLDAEEIVVYHFLDSLSAARIVAAIPNGRLVDLGAGAGLPSLPLKFAFPELRVLLVESVRKKVAFCQEVIRATSLAGAEAIWGRGEDFGARPGLHHGFDWAVSRALGSSVEVAALAMPFLGPGGRLVIYKGEPPAEELLELGRYCDRLRASFEARPVAVPHLAGTRTLVIVESPPET